MPPAEKEMLSKLQSESKEAYRIAVAGLTESKKAYRIAVAGLILAFISIIISVVSPLMRT